MKPKRLPKYLGGAGGVMHMDDGALRYLVDRFCPRTGIDLGCGLGGMARQMSGCGIQTLGIDGDWTVPMDAPLLWIIHDYTTGPLRLGPVDRCWCVEFLEHIAERHLPNVFATLESCGVVFCTHAVPDDRPPIPYHVNVRPEDYWIAAFENRGFASDADATKAVRRASTMGRDFVRDTGKVFRRPDLAQDAARNG